MTPKELKDKIAKMKLGLDNEFIQAEQKESLKLAIANAEKMLAEMEKPNFDFNKEIDLVYKKSGFINNDYSPEGKLLELLQDNSLEAYEIYQKLNANQKEQVLLELFSMENDMDLDEDVTIESSKQNLEMFLEDSKNGKIYAPESDKNKPAIKPETAENPTLTFFKKALTNETFLKNATSKFKATLEKKDIWMASTLDYKNLFVTLRAEKMLKLFCAEFDINQEDVKELLALKFELHFAKKEAEKLEFEMIDLVVSNFVSKSQFAAMKSQELNDIKRSIYETVMKMPTIGTGTDKYFLHYFNSGSDFYISELDYGQNQQDFGFAILNGDLQIAERGYISISEMINGSKPAELDLYFEPISHKDLIEQLEEKEQKKETDQDETKKGIGVFETKYYNFVETLKMIPDDEVLSKYRAYEEKNYHIENIVLMAVKVGNKKQLETAKEIYIEFLEQNAVDKDLSKKREDLYYELHDKFRKKYLKVDEPTISENQIEKLINRSIAQIFLEYGNNTEIKSIKEIVSDKQIDVHFELIREIDGMRDRSETAEVHISFDGEILDEFTFKVQAEFDVNKFLGTIIDDLDARSRNEIYSYNIFLKEHAEELIGEKVATRTVKNLPEEKQNLLKEEYKKRVKQKSTKTAEKKVAAGKVRLTKRLIAHGVTQEMVDQVNRTKEGVSIRTGKQATGKNTAADKRIKFALLPGKRLSANGTIYYEIRKNRSDRNPEKGL